MIKYGGKAMNRKSSLIAAMAALGLIYTATTHAGEVTTQAEAAVSKPAPATRVEPAAPTLSFALEVENGVTKHVFKIHPRGKINFTNNSPDKELTIESKAEKAPFDVPGQEKPQWKFTVPPNSRVSVTVDEEYDEQGMDKDYRFSYSSQIGDSKADDPIVIIERP